MFLSAYDDAVLVHQANVHGALGYLVKPVDPDRLTRIIRNGADAS
jgi:DNA-binding NarL/FixJ family response regulator